MPLCERRVGPGVGGDVDGANGVGGPPRLHRDPDAARARVPQGVRGDERDRTRRPLRPRQPEPTVARDENRPAVRGQRRTRLERAAKGDRVTVRDHHARPVEARSSGRECPRARFSDWSSCGSLGSRRARSPECDRLRSESGLRRAQSGRRHARLAGDVGAVELPDRRGRARTGRRPPRRRGSGSFAGQTATFAEGPCRVEAGRGDAGAECEGGEDKTPRDGNGDRQAAVPVEGARASCGSRRSARPAPVGRSGAAVSVLGGGLAGGGLSRPLRLVDQRRRIARPAGWRSGCESSSERFCPQRRSRQICPASARAEILPRCGCSSRRSASSSPSRSRGLAGSARAGARRRARRGGSGPSAHQASMNAAGALREADPRVRVADPEGRAGDGLALRCDQLQAAVSRLGQSPGSSPGPAAPSSPPRGRRRTCRGRA